MPKTIDPAMSGVAFPGQGIDPQVLCDALCRFEGDPLIHRLYQLLGVSGAAEVDLNGTWHTQPCIYAVSLLRARHVLGAAENASVAVGHSLGELTALAFAGGISAETGLELAIARGQACGVQQDSRQGAMAAIMGLGAAEVEWVRRMTLAEHDGILEVANINSAKQIVLSGDRELVLAAMRRGESIHGLVRELPVHGAFHSPLMANAIADWAKAINAATLNELRVPIVSATDGAIHVDTEECAELLIKALVLPVHWEPALRTVAATGVTRMWDAGPGTVLHDLGRRIGVVEFVQEGAFDAAA